MEKVRYHEMLPHEILARRRKFPVAFLPLGTIEWHGEHLAVGLDGLKAQKLCDMAAEKSGGFSFPCLWYGEPRVWGQAEVHFEDQAAIRKRMGFKTKKWSSEHFGKSGDQQAEFYKELVYHTLIQMSSLEMRAVCLECGHAPLAGWGKQAAKRFNENFSDMRVFAGLEFMYSPKKYRGNESFPINGKIVGVDHAGKWETSMLWYLRPDCVDTSQLDPDPQKTLLGVGGRDPRTEAAIELGRRACEIMVDGMIRKGRELLKEVRS